MADLISEFDRLKTLLPNASAGLIEDVWHGLATPKTMPAFRAHSRLDQEKECIRVLRHCLSSFDNEKLPSGVVDHVAWETLINILGRSLNGSDLERCNLVDRITGWNEAQKQFARDFANSVFNSNMNDWKRIIERINSPD